MKEEYLHLVWLTKRLPMHRLQLTDGRPLKLIRTGTHNHDSGPDFFNGSVEIDGISWNGNIEIHIKSSDWYAHKHHFDEAYNNVILHVVYRHDKPVLIHGQEIPTLELKPLLDHAHWSTYESLVSSDSGIPCESLLPEVDPLFVAMQTDDMLIARMQRRSEALELRFRLLGGDLQRLQYEALAQSFGTRVNALPFMELTQRMPLKTVWREGKEAAPALLLGAAGFLDEPTPKAGFEAWQHEWRFLALKHRLQTMQKHSWKFKGLRPPGFPDVRILQFAEVISRLRQDFSLVDKNAEALLDLFNTFRLPEAFRHLLLINAVAPLLWWYGHHKSDPSYRRKALELLERLPPERNAIVDSWKKLGVACSSAGDSQALLELKNGMCARKQCLSCKIGHQVLGKKRVDDAPGKTEPKRVPTLV